MSNKTDDKNSNNYSNSKLKLSKQLIDYSLKSSESKSENSTLINSSTSSLYNDNRQINEFENNLNNGNQRTLSSLLSNSTRNKYEYKSNKTVSEPYLSRPTSTLLNEKNNNEILSININNYQKLKPNPLANSVDPKIVQYNSNLLNYNKLLESESSSRNIDLNKKALNYINVNNTIKDDIKAFMKTKKNLEKELK